MTLSEKIKELEDSTTELIHVYNELDRVTKLVYERLLGYHRILKDYMTQEEIEKKLYEHRTSFSKRPINIATSTGSVLDGLDKQQKNRRKGSSTQGNDK